jgi:signal transduction histidine kinase
MATLRKFWTGAPATAARTMHGSTKSAREAALEKRLAELEKQLQAREDFLAMAAHELRNPMTPISPQLELSGTPTSIRPCTSPRSVKAGS